MSSTRPSLAILGIRGIPAAHGGFETFAEKLSLYLVAHGWKVTVYCQNEAIDKITEDVWRGVHRIHIPVADDGGASSVLFDWKTISNVIRRDFDVTLTLGYNTAVFCARLRARGIRTIINMDGIEWARPKWSWPTRIWFYLNDLAGCWLAHHLIADHPEIRRHLLSRTRSDKISVIGYGADEVALAATSAAPLEKLGLEPGRFITLIARPEPENSTFELVKAFSARQRNVKLVVLGRYVPERVPFHAKVLAEASDEVVFAGAIYDQETLRSLRAHSLFYTHGHRVGGTNPSLLEALGAGNAVLAHDNRFNRGVAQDAAVYFSTDAECAAQFDALLAEPARLDQMRQAARRRHAAAYTWQAVLSAYETLLCKHLPESKLSSVRHSEKTLPVRSP